MFEELLAEIFGNNPPEPGARLLLFLLVVILTWQAQRRLRRVIVALIGSVLKLTLRLGRTDFPFRKKLIQSLLHPTQLLVVAGGTRFAVAFIHLTPTMVNVADIMTMNVITFAVFWMIYRVADTVAQFYITKAEADASPLDETIVRFVRHIVDFMIIIFGAVLIMQQWGQDVGALVAGLGIASLAVALAAQETLANVIAYFAIVADAPFKVGDSIIVADTVRGRVEEISFRSTRIRAIDNSVMIMPNQTIANANVINWARSRKRRIDMVVGVTYSTTSEQIELAIEKIRAMLTEHEDISSDRLVVDFVEFGDSALNIRVSFLVRSYSWEDLEAAKTEINLKIMRILKEIDVSVAFPTRTIHLFNETPENPGAD